MESLRAENEAITKYEFNKEQIALSLFISRVLFLFSLFSKSEKNDVSLSVRSELHRSSFGFIPEIRRLMATRWRFFNGSWTSFSCMKSFCFR